MSFFDSLALSAGGLNVERARADVATANLTNANATRSADGGPYRRRDTVLESEPIGRAFGDRLQRALRGARVKSIATDNRPPREIFKPGHPDADAEGIVRLPNISTIEEMVNLMSAQRSYEANLEAMQVSREMAQRALRIGRTG